MGLTKPLHLILVFTILVGALQINSAIAAPQTSNRNVLSDPSGQDIFLDLNSNLLPSAVQLRSGQELYLIIRSPVVGRSATITALRPDSTRNQVFEQIDVVRNKVPAPNGYRVVFGSRFLPSLSKGSGFIILTNQLPNGHESFEVIKVITWP